MPISSIVITLSPDALSRRSAIDALSAHPRLTVGERKKRQLPVVVDTETLSEGISLVRDELPEMEGVEFVHVISVDFSDMDDFDEKLPPRRRRRNHDAPPGVSSRDAGAEHGDRSAAPNRKTTTQKPPIET